MPISSYRFPGAVGAVEAYAAMIDGLSGGPPIAHWRLGEVAGTQITDRKAGARHGTYSGTIGFGAAGLPRNSDTAVDFGGTGSGSIPHDSGLELSAFSLSFWGQVPSIPEPGEPNVVLLSKGGSGSVSGDLTVRVEDDGSLTVQFQDVSNFTVSSTSDAIVPGVPFHVCIRAENTGFDVYLSGQYLGKNTGFTAAWANNQRALLLAASELAALSNCILDEVALYARVLAQAEVLELAQQTMVPIAVNDTASVPENATTTIDVAANDNYVGAKANLAVEIMAQPSGGDSVSVNGDNDIDYAAGAVSADTARSFTYRITDPNGTSNAATVSVTVLDSGAPASSQANCYIESSADMVVVTSMPDLESAINAAPPGRNILIAANANPYTGGTLTFNPAGTAPNPIVVRPQAGIGTVTINSPNWTLAAGSSRLVISKLFFNDANFNINGSHHRLSRCRFRQQTRDIFNLVAATDLRIDHCDFSDFADSVAPKQILELDNASIGNESLRNILLDYNYIHDIAHPTAQAPSANFIRHAATQAWDKVVGIVLDHNLFRNNNVSGQGEFIVVKSSGVKIKFCTFENQSGYLQQRQGGGWEVRSCWFENVSRGALKCFDHYQAGEASGAGRLLVIGNRLEGDLDLWIGAGNENGGDGGYVTPNPYFRSREGRFIGNIVGGQIIVGEMWSSRNSVFPALNNNLWDNTGTVTLDHEEGTTFNQDDEPYADAVKLTPADVGLAAPDPLCPSGPQS